MPFKIVQTIENGQINLTVVPSLWETNRILSWPPKGYKYPIMKLLKDEYSRPASDWGTITCALKRSNMRTYDDANMELTHMERNTDTDSQENENDVFPTTSTYLPKNNNVINFDKIAEKLIHSQAGASQTPMKNSGPVQQETTQLEEQVTTVQLISSENSEMMLSNQTQFLNKLNLILENQDKIAFKIASLSVQLNETDTNVRLLQNINECNVTLLQDASLEERQSFCLKPMETKEEFEMFEVKLEDKTHRKNLIKTLSTLYSSKPGEGQTCAYKLIDVLFAREFLCQCSWSGGSKGTLSKIPMKNFMNFRKLCFDVIRLWDPTFTNDKLLSFLKLVLRNANKRKSMQGLRESVKRIRKSKKSVTQVDNEINVPEDSNLNTHNPEATE